MTAAMRMLLRAFAALALVAGFLLFPLAAHTDRWFSWTIEPPLTAAFLGAAYWAAFVLLAWSSRHDWTRARAAFPPVLTIAILLLVATLVHVDRFHQDSLFGWFWIVAYLAVPPLSLAVLWREVHARPSARHERLPLPPALRALLAIEALAMAGMGVALLFEERGFWPWTLTPLTAMAIGAFLAGFGVAAAHAALEDDARGFHGAALAYAALGALELLALAIFAENFDGDTTETVVYVAAWSTVLATGLAGYASSARSASSVS